jgi:hypothetical protein
MDQSIERWLPVVGFEGSYEVSDQGRVRSLDRVVRRSDGGTERRKGQMMFRCVHHSGYTLTKLRKDGKARPVFVHVLVAEAFLGPKPSPSHQVAHRDGGRNNNALDNLRWATPKQNAGEDRNAHGRTMRGAVHNKTPFVDEDIYAIRQRHATGESQASIARSYDVSAHSIHCIVRRKSWTHI